MTASLPSALDISENQPFNKAVLDQAFSYIVQRFLILESFKPSWQDQIDQLNTLGLNRINDALKPVYDSLVAVANLGSIFTAHSTSTVTPAKGLLTFVLTALEKNRFATAPYMAAMSVGDPTTMVFGTLSSYDAATGTLVLNVDNAFGANPSSNWIIGAEAPFGFHAARTDNPHVVTAHQAGAYTSAEVDAMVQAIYTAIVQAVTSAVTQAAQHSDSVAAANAQLAQQQAIAMAIAL